MNQRRLYLFLIGALILLALIQGAPPSRGQDQPSVALSALDVGVAEQGVIDGLITCSSANCGGFSVTLRFDPEAIRVDSIEVGPFLGQQVFLGGSEIDNVAGTIKLIAAAMAPPTPGADNVLFRITVTGLVPGSTPVEIETLDITDTSGTTAPGLAQGTLINVLETGKIPPFNPTGYDWEVAYVSEQDGNPEIYVMAADGSHTRRLTDNPARDGSPDWSPDGTKIAFVSTRDGNPEIYVMDADGGNVVRLTDNPATDVEPAWSPDGRQIAFVSDRDGNREIYLMDADGGNVVRLTDNPTPDELPSWSANGQEIAFVSGRDTGTSEVYIMKKDGSEVHRITDGAGANAWYPAWSPDGTQMSFTAERDGLADIFLVAATGGSVTQLTDQGGWLTLTDWAPDDRFIAFMSGMDGEADLYVLNRLTGRLFRLTENDTNDYEPDWKPVTPPACTVRTEQSGVTVRVGPGTNRGAYTVLPPNQDFAVLGQALDGEGAVWYELDKAQFGAENVVNSLWVAASEVVATGGCGQVTFAEAPPIVPISPRPTPGGWGGCGSCDTCGHPGECVLSPDGQCLWDPATCSAPPPPAPDQGQTCYFLTRAVNPAGAGSIGYDTKPNCPQHGYLPGTVVTLTVSPASGYSFDSWSGCGVSSSSISITITMTSSCTITANFSVISPP